MTLFPKIKLKTLPTFPSTIYGGTGIEVAAQGGALTVNFAWQEFGSISAIPTSPTSYILTYDTASGAYVMVPSHLLGGAASGIADAPVDGNIYGRDSAAWQKINANVAFNNRAALAAATTTSGASAVQLLGYNTPLDNGGAFYLRLNTAPATVKEWHVQSADGVWWQMTDDDIVCLEMFGGFPGTPVDAAWAAAWDYLNTFKSSGCTLDLLYGAYLCNNPLPLPPLNGKILTLRGRGMFASRLQANSTGPIITLDCRSSVAMSNDLMLENFGIVTPNNAGPASYGILISNRFSFVMRGVYIGGMYQGIIISSCYGFRIEDCLFTSCGSTAIGANVDDSCNGMVLQNTGVFSCGNTDGSYAVDLGGGSGWSITGCDLEGSHAGLRLSGVVGGVVAGNYFERHEINIAFIGSNSIEISGNWFGEQSDPLTFDGLSKSRVANNAFYNCQITFSSTAQDIDWGYNDLSGTAVINNTLPWNAPSLLNGWANQGGGYTTAGYRRHADGTVELKGGITGSQGSDAINLPIGYRSSQTLYFVTSLDPASAATGRVAVSPNGNVYIYQAPGGFICLDGIRFMTV